LKREGAVQPKPYAKVEPPMAKKDTHMDRKGKSKSPNRDRDIGHILFLKRGELFNTSPNLGRKVIKSATKKKICFLICLS
jgi:hypothetical protein